MEICNAPPFLFFRGGLPDFQQKTMDNQKEDKHMWQSNLFIRRNRITSQILNT
jgi:hypothetical protein